MLECFETTVGKHTTVSTKVDGGFFFFLVLFWNASAPKNIFVHFLSSICRLWNLSPSYLAWVPTIILYIWHVVNKYFNSDRAFHILMGSPLGFVAGRFCLVAWSILFKSGNGQLRIDLINDSVWWCSELFNAYLLFVRQLKFVFYSFDR